MNFLPADKVAKSEMIYLGGGCIFEAHDPTSLNKQGNDVGTQYRSIILCTDEMQGNAYCQLVISPKVEKMRKK